MANGHPQFGGTNGVAVLDLGQRGGTRATAGTAMFTGQFDFGAEETRSAEHRQAQGQTVFRDHLGSSGARMTLNGTIRTNTAGLMRTIIAELNELKTGSRRADDGTIGAIDPAKFKPTRLTDYDSTVLSERVIIEDWWSKGPRRKGPEWAAILQVGIRFKVLG